MPIALQSITRGHNFTKLESIFTTRLLFVLTANNSIRRVKIRINISIIRVLVELSILENQN